MSQSPEASTPYTSTSPKPRFVVTPDLGNSWDVFDNLQGHVLFATTEAIASITVFALNAVVEDRILTKLMPPNQPGLPPGPRYAGFYCQDYNGPTEGVAPLPKEL